MPQSVFRFDPSAVPAAIANRFLESEAWAQASLATHAGSVLAIVVAPLTFRMRIDAGGTLVAVSGAVPAPALTLRVSPFDLPAFLAQPERWNDLVVEEGDAALAATLRGLAETLPWFVEKALAAVLGPIAGQRVADGGRRLLAFPGHAARRIAASIASFAREEARFAVAVPAARSFAAEAAEMATRSEALERRVDALPGRLALPKPRAI